MLRFKPKYILRAISVLLIHALLLSNAAPAYSEATQSTLSPWTRFAAATDIGERELLWLNIHGYREDVEKKEKMEQGIKEKLNRINCLKNSYDVASFVLPEDIRHHVCSVLKDEQYDARKIVLSGHNLVSISGSGCIEQAIRGVCDAFNTEGFELFVPLDLVDNTKYQDVTFDDIVGTLFFTQLCPNNSYVFLDDRPVDKWASAEVNTESPVIIRFYTSAEKMFESMNGPEKEKGFWDEEIVRAVRAKERGEVTYDFGKSLINRTAFYYISQLIGRDLNNPPSDRLREPVSEERRAQALIDEIRRHVDPAELEISKTRGDLDPILAGFELDELRYRDGAYELPIYREGVKRFYYKFYKEDDGKSTWKISLRDGDHIYVELVDDLELVRRFLTKQVAEVNESGYHCSTIRVDKLHDRLGLPGPSLNDDIDKRLIIPLIERSFIELPSKKPKAYYDRTTEKGREYIWVGYPQGRTIWEILYVNKKRIAHGCILKHDDHAELQLGIEDRSLRKPGDMQRLFKMRQGVLKNLLEDPPAFAIHGYQSRQIRDWNTFFFYVRRGYLPVNREARQAVIDKFIIPWRKDKTYQIDDPDKEFGDNCDNFVEKCGNLILNLENPTALIDTIKTGTASPTPEPAQTSASAGQAAGGAGRTIENSVSTEDGVGLYRFNIKRNTDLSTIVRYLVGVRTHLARSKIPDDEWKSLHEKAREYISRLKTSLLLIKNGRQIRHEPCLGCVNSGGCPAVAALLEGKDADEVEEDDNCDTAKRCQISDTELMEAVSLAEAFFTILGSKKDRGSLVRELKGITIPQALDITPEGEQLHAIEFVRQIDEKPKPSFIALGTSWIKGYEKDRFLQYDALNPLITSLRQFCDDPDHNIEFIDGDDEHIARRIGEIKQATPDAQGIVLAGEDMISGLGLQDDANVLLAGVDNKHLTIDSYIRLMEMLNVTLELFHMKIKSEDIDEQAIIDKHRSLGIRFHKGFITFEPDAEPMDYEMLKEIYKLQRFA